jgi:hypothetical protein
MNITILGHTITIEHTIEWQPPFIAPLRRSYARKVERNRSKGAPPKLSRIMYVANDMRKHNGDGNYLKDASFWVRAAYYQDGYGGIR